MRLTRMVATLSCASLVLAGCATPTTTNIRAGTEWGSSLHHLGISAFYPPREDVRVGDVLMVVTSHCATNLDLGIPATVLMGHLPADDLYSMNRDFYGWRGELPPSEDQSAGDKSSTSATATGATTAPIVATADAAKTKADVASTAETAKKAKSRAAAAAAALKADPTNEKKKAAVAATAKAAQQANKAATQAPVAATRSAKSGSATAAGSGSASIPDVTLHLGENETVTLSASTSKAVSGSGAGTTKSSGSLTASAGTIFAFDADGTKLARPNPYTRLREAAFPSVDLGTASNFGLDATIPASGLLSIFAGVSRETVSQVRVSASNVVEDQLPLPAIYNAATAFFATEDGKRMMNENVIRRINGIEQSRMREKLREMGPKVIKQCGDWVDSPPVFAVISQVFYAYTFDFDVGNKVGNAAAVAAKLAAPSTSSTNVNSSTSQATSSSSTGTASQPPSQPYLPNQIQSSSGQPGGGLHVEYGQTGNLVLKETFTHPLAFGYVGNALFTFDELPQNRMIGVVRAKLSIAWRRHENFAMIHPSGWSDSRAEGTGIRLAVLSSDQLDGTSPTPGNPQASSSFDRTKACSASNFDPLYCPMTRPLKDIPVDPRLPPGSTMEIPPNNRMQVMRDLNRGIPN